MTILINKPICLISVWYAAVTERLSDAAKAKYEDFHDKFIHTSAALLKEYDKNGGDDLKREIERYLWRVDAERGSLECKIWQIK